MFMKIHSMALIRKVSEICVQHFSPPLKTFSYQELPDKKKKKIPREITQPL